jgi:hypothetical protein
MVRDGQPSSLRTLDLRRFDGVARRHHADLIDPPRSALEPVSAY